MRIQATLVLLLSTVGCQTTRESFPARTATEQLLLSAAADRSLDSLTWTFADQAGCYIQADGLEVYDKPYVLASIRNRILLAGGRIVTSVEEADLIFELRSAGLSVDNDKFLIGFPSLPVPIPSVGTITTPELALFAINRKHGVAKFGYHVWHRAGGTLKHSEELRFGGSHLTEWTVLLIGFTTQDILPEELD